jgi:hypothetical protein
MKIYKEGDKSKAICSRCGLVETIFLTRNVPIKGTSAIAKNILAGVCSLCAKVVSIPQQSAPYIKEALHKGRKPLEVRIPQHFNDILANASIKIGGEYTSSLVNFLIKYYIHSHYNDSKAIKKLLKVYENSTLMDKTKSNNRLSVKIDEKILNELKDIRIHSNFKNETEVVKAIVLKINDDIVQEKDKKAMLFFQSVALAVA